MKLHTIIIIISLNILFFLSTLNIAYSDECEEQSNKQIDNYIKDCQDLNDNIQEIGFAPHQSKDNRIERIEKSYPYKEEFPIEDKKYKNQIYFYTNIKKGKNNGIPKYIWHLIISPAPKIQQKDDAEGFIVNIGSIGTKIGNLDELGLVEEKEKKYLARSLVEGTEPVIYTNNELDSRYPARTLNEIWEKLVKNQNFLLIKCERLRKGETAAYDYTFYLHKIDAEPNNINLDFGYRIPSMKTITSAGEVYGLVLKEDGSCLGFTKITATAK